jgi:hypothetical protein
MHRLTVPLVVAGAALLLTPPIAAAQRSADEAGVRAAVQQYFRGHATGDSVEMRKAFLPTAHIEGLRNGAFSSRTLDEYVGGMRGTPPADEAQRVRTIDEVSVTGTAATAKATLLHGPTHFTDYFVLLKVNNEWKIANKVYHAAPRAK